MIQWTEMNWPTPLESDGTAPVIITLLGSSDAFVVRQAVYLIAVGAAFKPSGYEIKAFQQPIVGNGGGVTVPLVVKNSNGQPVAIYTNSEEWTSQACTRLLLWIRDLIRAGADKMPVVVITQHDSDEVKALPQVSQFIYMPAADDARVKLIV